MPLWPSAAASSDNASVGQTASGTTHSNSMSVLNPSASAVIPIFGFPEWEYDLLAEVLVYPTAFDDEYRLGEDACRYIRKPSDSLSYFALSAARDPRPLIIHEGIPGHYFQLALSWAHPNPIRRRYFDSGANEGIDGVRRVRQVRSTMLAIAETAESRVRLVDLSILGRSVWTVLSGFGAQ